MTTSFQLPVLRNLEFITGNATTIPIELGLNLSAFGTYGQDYAINASVGGLAADVSIVSAPAGSVSISVPSNQSFAIADGSGWTMRLLATSSADPQFQTRTLAWGRVNVTTPKTISPQSPIYHAVQMVAGDEFTFNVNLNTNITGASLGASLFSFADGLRFADAYSTPSPSLSLSVISPATGIVQVTVSEVQSRSCRGAGASWWLQDFSAGSVLRAGPVVAYQESSASAAASTPVGASSTTGAAAAPPNLGSVFL